MQDNPYDQHLSQISTQWTLIFQAHSSLPEQASSAQRVLIDRYSGAVHRYLLGAVRDPDIASELDQEFALRFLRGDFHRADPSRGRFRDFVKRSLRNLMLNHFRRRRHAPQGLDGVPEPAVDTEQFETDFDRQFTESWLKELRIRAGKALAEYQKQTGVPYHTILQVYQQYPSLRSPELAELLSRRFERPINAGWVRTNLSRAREKYASFLLDEVRASLTDPTLDDLEQELIELNLLEFCRAALKRRGTGTTSTGGLPAVGRPGDSPKPDRRASGSSR